MHGWLFAWRRLRAGAVACLPDACLLCDAPAGRVPNLCAACATDLVRLPPRRQPFVAYPYTPPISTLIHWMKFDARLPAALTLGTLMAHALAETQAAIPDALVPVPLHPHRLRARGFNQALELARPLATLLKRPLLARACARVRATRPQSTLQATSARRGNVKGAFRACRRLQGYPTIAIVDDVLTTGSTVAELGRVLRRAGVRRVLVWACAGPSGGALRRRD